MKTKGLLSRTLAFAISLMLCFGMLTIPTDTAEAATGGITRALLVACPDSNLGQGPYNDVMIMRAALINMGVRPEHIKVISNKIGTTAQHAPDVAVDKLSVAEVNKMMDAAYANSTDEDTNIFYYSGHGSKSNQQGTYGTTRLAFDEEYYATEDLAKDLAEYKGRKVVFLDACNSGGLVNKSYDPVEVTDDQLQQEMAEDLELGLEIHSRSTAHTNNFLVITAASAREDSLGGTFGMFTRSLASGMGVTFQRKEPYTMSTVYYDNEMDVNSSAIADQNKDYKITLNELYNHVYRDTVGSVPVVYPEKSDEVLFEYTAPAPAYVNNMKVSGPDVNGYIEGTFEYTGPGVPTVRISGYCMIYTGSGLYSYEMSIEPNLSKGNGNTYNFSASGLNSLKSRLFNINGTLVTYGFAVDVKRSTDYFALYRHPISITNSSTGTPNISFSNVSNNQPDRLLPGQQEYRLQIAFDRDCTIDLHIYDKNGNRIRTLANNMPSKMRFSSSSTRDMTMDFYWDGRNDNGNFVPGDGFEARAVARNNTGTSSTIIESRLSSLRVGVTPTGISIDQQQNTVGQSKTIILNTSASPENAYSGADWTSSNPDIATVSSKGVVTGKSEGEVIITATSRENPSLTATTTVSVFRYGWQIEADGSYYYLGDNNQRLNGWQYIDGSWYFFKDTIMQRSWVKDGGSWYYMKSNGAMATGWIKDGSSWHYLKSSGAMATGWLKDGGKWYYMNASGSMISGWLKDGGSWYYLKSNGAMATGWLKDGGSWYYMKSNGAMGTGWQMIGGKWYYMNASGKMTTGWQQVGGKWYYMYTDGSMAISTTIGGKYKLGADGAMI